MTEHLSFLALTALADGELSVEELTHAKEHLESCMVCTSNALAQSLLKAATHKAGRRHSPTDEFENRMKKLIAYSGIQPGETALRKEQRFSSRLPSWNAFSGWATAAMLLVAFIGWQMYQYANPNANASISRQVSLVAEVSDLHIATLAANQPPEVLSSDRHTVKPWFQGKIPFAFNLPENLPQDTKLVGANLTYLNHRPIAQLIYSIGQHRVSVFVRQRTANNETSKLPSQDSGFQIEGFCSGNVCAIGVSDVDRARLVDLVGLLEKVQTPVAM